MNALEKLEKLCKVIEIIINSEAGKFIDINEYYDIVGLLNDVRKKQL